MQSMMQRSKYVAARALAISHLHVHIARRHRRAGARSRPSKSSMDARHRSHTHKRTQPHATTVATAHRPGRRTQPRTTNQHSAHTCHVPLLMHTHIPPGCAEPSDAGLRGILKTGLMAGTTRAADQHAGTASISVQDMPIKKSSQELCHIQRSGRSNVAPPARL